VPAVRKPDEDDARLVGELRKRVGPGGCERRLGIDVGDALNEQGDAREQATRVALAPVRGGGRADKPERSALGLGNPSADLRGSPLVFGAAERHKDRRCIVQTREARDSDEDSGVTGCLPEQRRQLVVEAPELVDTANGADQNERDVRAAGDAEDVRRRLCGREGSRPDRDADLTERRAPPGRQPGGGLELVGFGHEPDEHEFTGLMPCKRPGDREQRVEGALVEARDEQRAAAPDRRRLRGCGIESGILPRIAPSSSRSPWLGSIPNPSARLDLRSRYTASASGWRPDR
jgi:hypothetical protein